MKKQTNTKSKPKSRAKGLRGTSKSDDYIGAGGAVVSALVPLGNFAYYFTQREKYPNAAKSALHIGIVNTVVFTTILVASVTGVINANK